MKINRKVLLTLSTLLPGTVLAGTMGTVAPAPEWMKVLAVSIGPAWTSNGISQTISYEPDLQYAYLARKVTSALLSGEAFAGLQHELAPWGLIQFGIAGAATTYARLDGDALVDADPDFNLFTYGYKVRHSRVAAKAKLISTAPWFVQPYLSGSVGVGFNRSSNFTTTPKISQAVSPSPFRPNTVSSFAYTAGIGVQRSFNENWQFGVGYEFASWGCSALSPTAGQTLNTALRLGHLYTNQLQFTLSTAF